MTHRVTVPAMMAALTVVLYGFAQLPVVGTPLLFVVPLPTVFVTVRQGPSAAALSLLTASVIIALLMTPIQAYLFLAPFGVLGLVTGILYYRDEPAHVHLAVGVIVLTAVIYLETVSLDAALGGQQPLNAFIDETAKQAAEMVNKLRASIDPAAIDPADPGAILLDPVKVKGLVRQTFLVPIWLSCVMAMALVYTNQVAAFMVGSRLGMPVGPPCSLRRLALPRIAGLAPFVCASLWQHAGGIKGGELASFYYNLMMLAVVGMYFTGISTSSAIVERANLRPGERLVIGLLSLIFFPLTVGLGLLECLLGLRSQISAPPEVMLETIVRPAGPARRPARAAKRKR